MMNIIFKACISFTLFTMFTSTLYARTASKNVCNGFTKGRILIYKNKPLAYRVNIKHRKVLVELFHPRAHRKGRIKASRLGYIGYTIRKSGRIKKANLFIFDFFSVKLLLIETRKKVRKKIVRIGKKNYLFKLVRRKKRGRKKPDYITAGRLTHILGFIWRDISRRKLGNNVSYCVTKRRNKSAIPNSMLIALDVCGGADGGQWACDWNSTTAWWQDAMDATGVAQGAIGPGGGTASLPSEGSDAAKFGDIPLEPIPHFPNCKRPCSSPIDSGGATRESAMKSVHAMCRYFSQDGRPCCKIGCKPSGNHYLCKGCYKPKTRGRFRRGRNRGRNRNRGKGRWKQYAK